MQIKSEQEMIAFGEKIGTSLKAPAVIELVGDVGVGKTTFVRGLAKGLGVSAAITSPSFTISKEYQGDGVRLVHYDYYRLNDPGLMADDLAESISDENTVTVVEWGDSIKNLLPKNHQTITIKYVDEATREVSVK